MLQLIMRISHFFKKINREAFSCLIEKLFLVSSWSALLKSACDIWSMHALLINNSSNVPCYTVERLLKMRCNMKIMLHYAGLINCSFLQAYRLDVCQISINWAVPSRTELGWPSHAESYRAVPTAELGSNFTVLLNILWKLLNSLLPDGNSAPRLPIHLSSQFTHHGKQIRDETNRIPFHTFTVYTA